jgi:hypothetical protein
MEVADVCGSRPLRQTPHFSILAITAGSPVPKGGVMGFLDRLFGREAKPKPVTTTQSKADGLANSHSATAAPSDVVSALQRALGGALSPRARQASDFALRYVRAVNFLDDCGEFTLEKLRKTYDIAGLSAPGTDRETHEQWEKSKLILSNSDSPGGPEFIRFDMRRLLLEGVTNAAPHIGNVEPALRRWLEQKR